MVKRSKNQSQREVEALRIRLEEAEETLRAIQAGEVDALVISGADGERIYAVQGAERPYRILVESMQEGAVTLSGDGIVLYCNRRFAEMLNLPLEQVLGAAMRTFVAPASQPAFDALMEQGWSANAHGEITLYRQDGTSIPAAAAFSALPLEEMPSSMCLVITDLTDQKRSEETARHLAIEQAARAEAEAGQRRFAFLTEVSTLLSASLDYQQIFHSLADLVLPRYADTYIVDLLDESGTLKRTMIAATDPGIEATFRTRAERYPPDPQAVTVWQVLRTGHPLFLPEVAPTWYEAVAPDAAYLELSKPNRPRSYMGLPLIIRDQVIGVLSLAMVNSDRHFTEPDLALGEEFARRLAQAIDNARLYAASQSGEEILRQKVEARTRELQAAVVRAESADQAKTILLSTVTHEMRTPLSSVIGFSNLLIARQTTPEKREFFTTLINAEARRLLALVDDFLDLQRLESGREVFHFSDVDLTGLVRDVVSKQDMHEQERYHLRLESMPVPWVYADDTRIRQVLVNLLSNAVKYSPNGGEIMVSVRPNESHVIISVQDHGLGIDPDELPHLFERFYRGSAAEELRIRGTGLGLALCKDLIQAHHGRIWAESPGPGQGATFFIALPIAETEAPRMAVHREQPVDSGPLIVVIEDDLYFSAYLAERLELEHYRVQTLTFAEAAPEQIASLDPALIVMGILHGDLATGWTLLTDFKHEPSTRGIPVLICSALQAAEYARRLGASAFVSRPVDETALIWEVVRLTN